jgi:hypothetical protein
MKSGRFAANRGMLPAGLVGLGAVGALFLFGCSKVSEAKDRGAPGAAPVVQELAAVAAGPTTDNANYRVAIRPVGTCKKGETCAIEVALEAKGEYHINEQYPYKFKVDEAASAGVKFPKPVVGKDDAVVEEKKLVLKIPFIADTAGDKKLAGTLSLSVCSAANCLMDKQPLEVIVKVQ